MKRRTDWPEQLAEFLATAEGKAFSEVYPCFAFADDCVAAMTGEHPWPERYDSIVAAYADMRSRGYESLRAAAADRAGPEIPVAFARRGDVVLRLDATESLGICDGERSWFIAENGGLADERTLEMSAAFRVG